MSDETPVEQSPGAEPRRSFLRKMALTALGAAAGAVGLQRPAEASRPGGPTPAAVSAYCCTLAYSTLCTTAQWTNCPRSTPTRPNGGNKWSWPCCAYVGSSLTRVSCRECYSSRCSGYAFIGSC